MSDDVPPPTPPLPQHPVSSTASNHPQDAYQAARVLSGKWVSPVLLQLARGPHYHNDLARSTGILENKPLDRTLQRLLTIQMINRTIHNVNGSAPRVQYQLTPLGHAAIPLIDQLAGWWHSANQDTF